MLVYRCSKEIQHYRVRTNKEEINMSKTTTKEVTKKEVKRVDYKAVAENLEKAFKANKSVEVIADTRLDEPASIYPEYSYVHFFKPGTKKNMFGCYMQGKNKTRFAISNKLVGFVDPGLKAFPNIKTVKGEKKTTFYIVECANADVVGVGQKILDAYMQMISAKQAEKPAKAEKEKKSAASKTKATKTTAKKAVNK